MNSWRIPLVRGKAVALVALCLSSALACSNSDSPNSKLVVSTVSIATSPEGKLLENVGFGYARISWTSGNSSQGWDVAKNLPL